MVSRRSKDSLTLFFADSDTLIADCTKPLITVTRRDVLKLTSDDVKCNIGVSMLEEADTLMMIHAIDSVKCGNPVEFYT